MSLRAAAVVGGAVVVLAGLRIALDGVQPYGTDGAEYIEHVARLETLELWRASTALGFQERIPATDGAFPAGLHLLTLSLGAFFGHGLATATATGVGWMLLLALATGACAASVLRERSVEAFAAGAVSVMLLPAVHGSAVRYYYDLPFVALLWAAAAALLRGQDRRPLEAGLVAGLLALSACLVKWSAIPYGAAIAIAALFAPSPRVRPFFRLCSIVAACSVVVLGVTGYLGGVEGTSSFGHQAAITAGSGDAVVDSKGAAAGMFAAIRGKTPADFAFYPLRTVVSVCSPFIAGALLLLALRALRSPRRALFATVVLLAQGVFVVLLIPVLDDRFLLPLVPAAVLLAVQGWASLEAAARRRMAVGFAIVGLVVAVDFHFAPPTYATWPVPLLDARADNSPWTRARGLGASSSVESRGWSRGDETEASRRELRKAVRDAVQDCGRGVCLATDRSAGAVGRYGDADWLRFEGMLGRERGGHEGGVVWLCPTSFDRMPQECVADMTATAASEAGERVPPGCVDEGRWVFHRRVDDPEGGPAVDLWVKAGGTVCGGGA